VSIYPPVESQPEIHAANAGIRGSWHVCPCEVCRTLQREAGLPVAQFGLTGTLRIHYAETFGDYGHLVEGGGRIIYCAPAQSVYAAKLLSTPPALYVTATLDAKGNVVKVS
jgi:hypothetical protein